MRAWSLVLGLCGLACTQTKPPQTPPRSTQVQTTRQFLAAALRGDTTAYKWLSPELRQQLGTAGTKQALGAVAAAGQRRGTEVELYKIGFQLEEDGTARPFVAYGWAADSAMRLKMEWLQVSFRDTAARLVMEFELRKIK